LAVSDFSGSSDGKSSRGKGQVSPPRSALVNKEDRDMTSGQAPERLARDLDDLYMRAIGQLGNKKAPVRLGALHALSRLGQNNPGLRQTVMQVICAYLRMPYTAPEGESRTDRTGRPNQRAELQVRLAAQSILAEHLRDAADGMRNDATAPGAFWPEIDIVDLSGASLVDLNLSGCRVRVIECNSVIFNGESLFRGMICDLAFFQNATFKGHADFRGVTFVNDAWFSHSAFTADAWFHGDEFFPAARFGRHVSFMHVAFARKALFGEVVFEGSADFEGVTCEKGRKAINMRGCQVRQPGALNPDITKTSSTWPPGWDIEVGRGGIVTLQGPRPPAVSELLVQLAAATDIKEFENILQDILSAEERPDAADRVKARREVLKDDWHDEIREKFGDALSIDMLRTIFQAIVIPDLDDPAVAKEISDWTGNANPAVIHSLLAAARVSGDGSWEQMRDIIEPAIAHRWAAVNNMEWSRDPIPESQLGGGIDRSRRGIFRRK
jgi:hypothetical protein